MAIAGDVGESIDQADLRFEACREEPLLDTSIEEIDLKLTTNCTKKELQAIQDFGVYDEARNNSNSEHTLTDALPTVWVN